MDWIFLATCAVCFIAVTLGGLILSHKIAGPVYRFGEYLKAINKGDSPHRPKFRYGDFFPELEDYLDEFHTKHENIQNEDDNVKEFKKAA